MIAHPRSALFERVRDSVIFVPFHSSAHKHFARKVVIFSLLPDFVQFFSTFLVAHKHKHTMSKSYFHVWCGSVYRKLLLFFLICYQNTCLRHARVVHGALEGGARTHCTLFSSSQALTHTKTKICQLLNGNKNGNEQQQQTMRDAGLNFFSFFFF